MFSDRLVDRLKCSSRLLKVLTQHEHADIVDTQHHISLAFTAILELGVLDQDFWEAFSSLGQFSGLLERVLLTDGYVLTRQAASVAIETSTLAELRAGIADEHPMNDAATFEKNFPVTYYIWHTLHGRLISATPPLPASCQEYFSTLVTLLRHMSKVTWRFPDRINLVATLGKLLLRHNVNEVRPLPNG